VNPIDLVAVALIVIAVLLGIRSGALPQLAGLSGAALGAAVGLVILPLGSGLLEGLPATIRAVVVLSLLLGLVGLGEGLGAAVGRNASHALGTGLLGALDRVSGGIVGAGQAVLIIWLMGGILVSGPFPSLTKQAQTSTVVAVLDAVLPPPTELVVELGHLLDNTGLPNVFIGLEQLPAPNIDLPSDALARQIGERAAGSVLRVVADGCQVRSSGTSFVIAPDYLVTNAHVVVGATAIVVQTSQQSFDAMPVLVDLSLDIAVLHVSGLNAPALHLSGNDPIRGDLGATFGYPGGGNAAVEPATVSSVYFATGLDVTGTERVTRKIVELRAHVQPGDSGGPLLLVDGSVGGVVFAESRVDPTVGYALAPLEVEDRIAPALTKTAAVSTGPCVH
jgi:S1-C subfamily serine protease